MSDEKQKLLIVDGAFIVCPDCREKITPADVESYRVCPFCGYIFEQTPEFEDFVISPLIRQWSKTTISQLFR